MLLDSSPVIEVISRCLPTWLFSFNDLYGTATAKGGLGIISVPLGEVGLVATWSAPSDATAP
jgi:hypothetical protein